MNEHRGLWRGKRVDNKEWATGYYMRIVRKTSIKEIIRHCIFTGVEFWDKLSGETALECYEIDPSTLGECVGFPDKNDNVAFEGDIIRAKYGSETVTGFVEYDRYIGTFVLNDGVYSYMLGSDIYSDECEIIGNLHDNPELLKGAADDE